ncbi:MAG: cupredoxin domain-containing protein [Nanoarchaeota archaeon]
MKSHFYLIFILAVLVVGGIFVFGKDKGDSTTGNSAIPPITQQGQMQNIVLSIKDYNYYPNTVNVKAGEPVRISLDKSVVGCYRTFTIPSLNVRKSLQSPSDYVEFTPTKAGTYKFACGMGMGYGTLVVE